MDFNNLKVGVDSTEVRTATGDMNKLGVAGSKTGKDVKGGMDAAGQGMTTARSSANLLRNAFIALGGVMTVQQIVAYSDAWQSASNQLRLVAGESASLERIQSDLMATSNNTRASFEGTSILYTKLARSTTALNLSHEDLVGLVTTVNQSFAANGATAQEMEGAIRQLAQGLAAGALRGDEFNSVAEQAPGIMLAIADSLGMTRGELREFAAEGGITAEIVVRSLQNAAGTIEGDYDKAIRTFGNSMTIARNNAVQFIGTNDAVTESVSVLGSGLILLSENLQHADVVLAAVAATVASRMIPALVTMTGPIGIAAAAIGTLVIALENLEDVQESAFSRSVEVAAQSGLRNIEVYMSTVTKRIGELDAELIKAQEQSGHAGRTAVIRVRREIEEEKEKLNILITKRMELLKEETDVTGEAVEVDESWAKVLEMLEDRKAKNNAATSDGTEETIKAIDATNEIVQEMRDQVELTGMTEREQHILNETMKLGEQATIGQIGAVAALAGAYYDQQEATNAAEEATREYEREQKSAERESARVAREMQRQWVETRDTFADFFVDMVNNGSSAFDSLLDSFKNMIIRMAAQWIGSGIMNFIGLYNPFSGGGAIASGAAGLLGGSSGSGLGGLANVAGSVAGSGITGGFGGLLAGLGDGVAGAGVVGPPTAAGSAAGGLFSGAGAFLTNPWTIGIAAALGIGSWAHNKFDDPDNYTRSFSGFLTAPTAGADPSDLFSVNPFASGFAPTGIARNASQASANANIDGFRGVDASITELTRGLGGSIDLSRATLGGLGLDGVLGTNGTFLGQGGKTQNIEGQHDLFAGQLVDHISGLDSDLMSQLQSANTAAEIIGILQSAESSGGVESQAQAELQSQNNSEMLGQLSELVSVSKSGYAMQDEKLTQLTNYIREMSNTISEFANSGGQVANGNI